MTAWTFVPVRTTPDNDKVNIHMNICQKSYPHSSSSQWELIILSYFVFETNTITIHLHLCWSTTRHRCISVSTSFPRPSIFQTGTPRTANQATHWTIHHTLNKSGKDHSTIRCLLLRYLRTEIDVSQERPECWDLLLSLWGPPIWWIMLPCVLCLAFQRSVWR